MKKPFAFGVLALLLLGYACEVSAQSLGNAGTVMGTVLDPTGAAVPNADVSLRNAVSGFMQTVRSGSDGMFRFVNVPPNPYRLEVMESGFALFSEDVDVKNAVPVQVNATLALVGANTTVTVAGAVEALETDPSAHVDVDRSLVQKLPFLDPAGGLSQAITFTTGGVSARRRWILPSLGRSRAGCVRD